MAIQPINIGRPNDGTGDDLRTAFMKVNENFTFLNIDGPVGYADNVGPNSGAGIYKEKDGATLLLRKLNSDDSSVTITQETDYVNIEVGFSSVEKDTAPKLGGNLDLNSWNIINTGSGVSNISADSITVSGVRISDLVSTISAMVYSNSIDLDFGSITDPLPYNLAFGGLLADPSNLELNFGTLANAAADSSSQGQDIDGGFA